MDEEDVVLATKGAGLVNEDVACLLIAPTSGDGAGTINRILFRHLQFAKSRHWSQVFQSNTGHHHSLTHFTRSINFTRLDGRDHNTDDRHTFDSIKNEEENNDLALDVDPGGEWPTATTNAHALAFNHAVSHWITTLDGDLFNPKGTAVVCVCVYTGRASAGHIPLRRTERTNWTAVGMRQSRQTYGRRDSWPVADFNRQSAVWFFFPFPFFALIVMIISDEASSKRLSIVSIFLNTMIGSCDNQHR